MYSIYCIRKQTNVLLWLYNPTVDCKSQRGQAPSHEQLSTICYSYKSYLCKQQDSIIICKRYFFFVFSTQNDCCGPRHSKWRPWKLGISIVAWPKPRMFWEESLGLELFRNGSVDEFYRLKALITLEQVNTLVVEKKRRILISKRLTGRML